MLLLLTTNERDSMTTEAELDAALQELGSHIAALQPAVQSIIDKVASLPNAPDLSDELATIQGFSAKVQQAAATLTGASA